MAFQAKSDVVSSDIVGYANDGLTQGEWKPVCAQFKTVTVDQEDMTLSALVPGGGWVANTDYIKVLKASAALDFEAVYVDYDKLGSRAKTAALKANPNFATNPTGWFKKSGSGADYTQNLDDFSLPYGSAVLAMTSGTGGYITTSGQVVESESGTLTFALTQGEWKFVGNCTPNALTLKDFVPGGGWVANTDYVKFFKSTAALDFEAVYVDYDKLGSRAKTAALKANPDFANNPTGWFKKSGSGADYTQNVSDTEIPAGSGFLAMSSGTEATISLPSAL